MRFFRDILYLSMFGGIGRGTLNREFVPWLRFHVMRDQEAYEDSVVHFQVRQDQDVCAAPAVRLRMTQDPAVCTPGMDPWTEELQDAGEPFALAEAWLRDTGRTPSQEEKTEARRRAEGVLEWLEARKDVTVWTVLDPEYPRRLDVMGTQRPLTLYIQGSMSSVSFHECGESGDETADSPAVCVAAPSLGVIGSRWPCEYALRYGPAFVEKLVETCSVPVVSGLARGCDRMGHEAAIRTGVPTIAIMPCGPDQIVPEVNRGLAERILDGHGFLLTEYPPGTPPAEYRYVERDRITAALSSAIAVVECAEESGTMQTVRAARSYHRPVACWLPQASEALAGQGFQGNLRMLQSFGAVRLHDMASLEQLAAQLQMEEERSSGAPEQLSFL